jgi:hypothetical protein
MSTTKVIEAPHVHALIAVSESTPPITSPIDAEVDVELLRSVPKAFVVEDERSASWVIRKVVAAREYGERVRDWAAQERRRAEREEMTLMYLFGRQIEQWAGNEITKLNGKRKSLVLPGGTVGFRKANAKLVVDDEQAVILWAKDNCPQAVVTVEKLAKIILDQYVHETGHSPEDGVHIEPETERFFIR